MALPATDVFTSGSNQALTTYSASWTLNAGNFQVNTTNDVKANGSAAECGAGWNADAFNNDQYSQVVLTALSSGAAAVGPCVRAATGGAASYYGFYTDNGASYLFVMSAGVWTQLGSSAGAMAVGNTMRIEASGSTITPYKNGSTTGTPGAQTDATLTSGRGGLAGYGTDGNNRMDTWEGGNLGGAAAASRPIFPARIPLAILAR